MADIDRQDLSNSVWTDLNDRIETAKAYERAAATAGKALLVGLILFGIAFSLSKAGAKTAATVEQATAIARG